MARPRLDPDGAVQVTLRLPGAQVAQVDQLALESGRRPSEVWRDVIATGLANSTTNREPGLFGTEGGGEDRGARALVPEAAPSHPEPRIQGQAGTIIVYDDPITANPSKERVVEPTVEDSVTAAKAARQARPAPPDQAARNAVDYALKHKHKHTPEKPGMPVPRCSCGAIRGQDNWWRLETRPELDEPDASIDPNEEW